jgi:DbpA RNA binding domain
VLDRFAFVEVPSDDADRVIRGVTGRQVRGQRLRLQHAGVATD